MDSANANGVITEESLPVQTVAEINETLAPLLNNRAWPDIQTASSALAAGGNQVVPQIQSTVNAVSSPNTLTTPAASKGGSKIKTQTPHCPAMPTSVVVGIIKNFVDLYSGVTECPPEFMWSSFVTIFGLAISPYVERDSATETQPRLYTCNIGPSGFVRKSFGAKQAMACMRNALGQEVKMVEGFGSSEGLLRYLEDAKGIPALQYLDELELLIKKANVSGSAGTVPLHVLFEANEYQHPLRKTGIQVTDAYLGVLANSTTERYPDIWQAENADSGFLSRWMLVFGQPRVRIPNPPRPDAVKLQQLCADIKRIFTSIQVQAQAASNGKVLIGFHGRTAEDLWSDFYIKDIDPNDEVYNRIYTIGERLMMILTVAQNKTAIDSSTVTAVIEFLKYQVQIRRILCPRIANNPVANMQQKILSRLPNIGDWLTKRKIYRAIHADREGPEIFDRALKGLVELGYLEFQNSQAEIYKRIA